MHFRSPSLRFVALALPLAALAFGASGTFGCSSSSTREGFGDDPDASTGGDPDAGSFGNDGGSGTDSGPPPTVTTVYANTDDTLFSLDPATKKVTQIGKFTGVEADDPNVTDCAVDGTGTVYVNTASVVYRVTLPTGGTGPVNVTRVAKIAAKTNQRFYGLGFVPAGVLDTGETLIGGDGNGELFSIDTATGATRDLGAFGPDGSKVLALSGDVVFYIDGAGKPTGLATVRSCAPGGTGCTNTNDYLAAIDMTALANAYKNGSPAASLLEGIYGGSGGSKGKGTGYGNLFGLGAWQGSVFGFQRGSSTKAPAIIDVDGVTGAGTVLDATSGFTNGWSGAGVTTTVQITVQPPK